MSTSHQRRKARRDTAAKAAVVACNLASSAKAPDAVVAGVYLGMNARFRDPIGNVFKARTVRKTEANRRFKRWGRA